MRQKIDWCAACKACEIKAPQVNAECGTRLSSLNDMIQPIKETSFGLLGVILVSIGLLLGAISFFLYIKNKLTGLVEAQLASKIAEIDKNNAEKIEASLLDAAKRYVFDAYNDFNQNKVVIRVRRDNT